MKPESDDQKLAREAQERELAGLTKDQRAARVKQTLAAAAPAKPPNPQDMSEESLRQRLAQFEAMRRSSR